MDYGIKLMKKMNNKYRNNNNQIYSLNYKFDSTSIAGKISGTALDLIKKYNELAKEAHGNGQLCRDGSFPPVCRTLSQNRYRNQREEKSESEPSSGKAF